MDKKEFRNRPTPEIGSNIAHSSSSSSTPKMWYNTNISFGQSTWNDIID